MKSINRPLRVLHIWKSDHHGAGGGAIAMNRLHNGLLESGIDSKILCANKTTDSPQALTLKTPRILRIIENRLQRLVLKNGLHDIHRISSFFVPQHPAFRTADVIHIHGIHGFLNYLALPLLTIKKPTVFTLHDIWPYTGHCAFSYDCTRWQVGCGSCPYPNNHPAIQKDNTHLEWMLKNWVYKHSKQVIVALSRRNSLEIQKSILAHFPVFRIPNGINTDIFTPLEKSTSRSQLGIITSKKIMMISALNLKDYHKGGDLLLAALQSLPNDIKKGIMLLSMGKGGDVIGKASGIEWMDLGFVIDEHKKVLAYSASDVFVHPSRAETLGLVLLESMACGTPLVAFDVGGIPDVLIDGSTGYLSRPEDPVDLSRGIVKVLDDRQTNRIMSKNGRDLVLKEFSLIQQVKKHIALYHYVIADRLTG